MNRSQLFAVVCTCLLFTGCSQKSGVIPNNVERLVLYSLECDFERDTVPTSVELLHGYLVLGKTEIDDVALRAEILDAVRGDIASGSEIYSCFDPHHAIRIVHNDTISDVVICYKCRGYERTENGKLKTTSYPMDVRSRDLLNRVLKSRGIALSPAATEELKRRGEQSDAREPDWRGAFAALINIHSRPRYRRRSVPR